jgi:hypothetical protein
VSLDIDHQQTLTPGKKVLSGLLRWLILPSHWCLCKKEQHGEKITCFFLWSESAFLSHIVILSTIQKATSPSLCGSLEQAQRVAHHCTPKEWSSFIFFVHQSQATFSSWFRASTPQARKTITNTTFCCIC